VACEAIVGESFLVRFSCFSELVPDVFEMVRWVFFVLRPDLIVETVSSSDSSSTCTHFHFGDAGSDAGFSASQYKSSSSAIVTPSILLLVFFMHSSTGSQ